MSKPKFEKFIHSYCTQVPTVSGYAKGGRFSFNRAAVGEFDLDDKKHCDLYFDKEGQQIGFVFLDAPGIGSVKVKSYRNNLFVAARNFCTHYGLDLNDIKKREIKKIGEMLVIKA